MSRKKLPSGPVAERVAALRKELGLSQDAVAKRGEFTRTYMVLYESGGNQVSTDSARRGLAKGFGLTYEDLVAYLDGRLPLVDAVRMAKGGPRIVSAERDPANLATVLRQRPSYYSAAAIAAARSLHSAEGRDLTEQAWDDFMRGVMVEERRALAPATAPLRAAETLDDELTQRRARAKKKRNEDKNS